MRNLTSMVEQALLIERATGIVTVIFGAGFHSLEDETVDSPDQATVFVRQARTESYGLEIVVRLEAAWSSNGCFEPIGKDAVCWAHVNHLLFVAGHWDSVGRSDPRNRIPFVINVRRTSYQLVRAIRLLESERRDDDPAEDMKVIEAHLAKPRQYRVAGWSAIEQSRAVTLL